MAEPRVERLIAEGKAEKISYSYNPVAKTMELVRRFRDVRDELVQETLSALEATRSYSNPQASAGAKTETYPGVFRVVSNTDGKLRPDTEDKQGIFQTLRLGFATTPEWDSARLISTDALQTNTVGVTGLDNSTSAADNELYKVVRFRFIDPAAVGSVIDTLRAETEFTDPSVGGVVLSGTWQALSVSDKEEDTGEHTLELTLARPQYTLSGYGYFGAIKQEATNFLWNVPKNLAQGIMDQWKALHPVGASARASYSTNQKTADLTLSYRIYRTTAFASGIVTEANCQTLELTDYWLGVDLATAESVVVDPNTVPQGWTYSRQFSDNGDGSFDVRLVYRQSKYAQMAEYTSETTAAQHTERTIQKNASEADISHLTTAVPAQGTILRQTIQLNQDCSRDVVSEKETSRDQTATAPTVNPVTHDAFSDNLAEKVMVERHSAATSKILDADAGLPTPGTSVDVKNTPNPDGTWQTEKKTTITKDQTATVGAAHDAYEADYAKTVTVERHTATGAPIPDSEGGVIAPGVLVEVKSVPRPDGLYETEKRKTTSQDQTATDGGAHDAYSSDKSEIVAVERHTAASAKLLDTDAGNPSPGVLVTVKNTPRPDGLYETEKTTKTVVDMTATGTGPDTHEAYSNDTARTVSVERHTAADSKLADSVAGVGPAGTVTSVKNTPRPDGKWETEKVVEVAKDLTSTAQQVSAGRIETTEAHTAAAAALPDAPVAAPGQTIRNSSKPRPDGLYETEHTVIEVQNQTASIGGASDTHFEDASKVVDVARQTAASAPLPDEPFTTAGTVVKTANTPRDDGTFSTEREVTVAADQTGTEKAVLASETVAVERHTAKSAVVADPTRTTGVSEVVRNTPRPDGLWETEKRTKTAVKVEAEATYDDWNGTNSIYNGKNLTLAEKEAKLATVDKTLSVAVHVEPSDEYPDLFNVSIRQNAVSGGGGTTGSDGPYGEIDFSYTNRDGESVYVFVLYTQSRKAAEDHLNAAPGGGRTTIGSDSGHRTTVAANGKHNFMAVRVEK